MPNFILILAALILGPTLAFAQESEDDETDWIKLSWKGPAPALDVDTVLWFDRERAQVYRLPGNKAQVQGWRVEGIRDALGLIARKRKPERVTVRDEKGYWKATVDWDVLDAKSTPLEIPIRWERCGRLGFYGKVDSTWRYQGPGSELREVFPEPRFSLRDKDGKRIPLYIPHKNTARWIPPGQYTALVSADKLVPHEIPVEIIAGGEVNVNYGVRRFPETRKVRGWLHPGSLSRYPGEQGKIWGMSVDLMIQGAHWEAEVFTGGRCGTGLEYHDFVYWTEVCEKELGQFEFLGVPKGTFDLEVRGHAGFFGIDILTKISGTPQDDQDLHLYLLDEPKGPGWGFSRTDFEQLTEKERRQLEMFRSWTAHVRPASTVSTIRLNCLGSSVSVPLSLLSKPQDWAVVIPSMQPIFGTAADFNSEGNGFQMAMLSPTPGWGKALLIVDPSGKPLAGAKVFFDDVEIGQSDAKGELIALTLKYPQSIRVDHGHAAWSGSPNDWMGSPWATVSLR